MATSEVTQKTDRDDVQIDAPAARGRAGVCDSPREKIHGYTCNDRRGGGPCTHDKATHASEPPKTLLGKTKYENARRQSLKGKVSPVSDAPDRRWEAAVPSVSTYLPTPHP